MSVRRTAFLTVVLGAMAVESGVVLGSRRQTQGRRHHQPATVWHPPATDLSKDAIRIQEQERRRIARDLHDLLGPRVTALRLKLEALRRGIGDADRTRSVEDLLGLTDLIDRELDFLAWQLRPPELRAGLLTALHSFVARWSKAYGIRAEFHATAFDGRLAPEVETCLYRIAQEALNNVIKHARASRVDVRLERRSGLVVLAVKDDGCGFQLLPPVAMVARDHHIGLIGMHERATLVRGPVDIRTAPSQGTTVVVSVPASFGLDGSGLHARALKRTVQALLRFVRPPAASVAGGGLVREPDDEVTT